MTNESKTTDPFTDTGYGAGDFNPDYIQECALMLFGPQCAPTYVDTIKAFMVKVRNQALEQAASVEISDGQGVAYYRSAIRALKVTA